MEHRIDKIDEKLDALKDDIHALTLDIKLHIQKMNDHVEHDEHMFKKIQPVLDDLVYKKESQKRLVDSVKKIGFVSAIMTVIYKGLRFFSFL